MSLRDQIEQEIRERGPIPFSRYMELCLYDPANGYYSRNAEQFGKAGDFYTSSDVHAVFGRLLARQFQEMWQTLDRPAQIEILELGPGRGLLARDVLDWSQKKFPDFFAAMTYTLQESSPALRSKLGENLREHIAGGKAVLSVLQQDTGLETQLAEFHSTSSTARQAPQSASRSLAVEPTDTRAPEGRASLAQRFSAGKSESTKASPGGTTESSLSFLGAGEGGQKKEVPEGRPKLLRAFSPETPLLVFANEFFDALPVEILSSQGKLHLALENSRLHEIWLPPTQEELEFLDRYSIHPEPGERIEISLAAQHWITPIAAAIRRGFLLAIDYGYTRSEQLAGRHRGTLMTYRQHSTSANPYQAPGEQDITAHVNFTALAAAVEQASMRPQKPRTQSQFLMGIGEKTEFADAFEDCRLPQEQAKVALQLKHLVTPAGMGETFHVLLASRTVDTERVAALSGLTFGN